jgi:hypothetical protein
VYFRFRHRAAGRRARGLRQRLARTKAQSEEVLAAIEAAQGQSTPPFRSAGIFGPHDRVLMPRIRALMLAHNGFCR